MTNNDPSAGHGSKDPLTEGIIPDWSYQLVGAAIFKRDSENSLRELSKRQSTPAQTLAQDKRHRSGQETKRSERSGTSPTRGGWKKYIDEKIKPSNDIQKGGI
ncbi:MAG: hypothetical protein MK137_03835 [Rickettsiales bacterium]|nr:hypothetical protein [Rickettsiales bacterium]